MCSPLHVLITDDKYHYGLKKCTKLVQILELPFFSFTIWRSMGSKLINGNSITNFPSKIKSKSKTL